MTPERSLYSDEVMDHFLHPRNSGQLADPTLQIEQLNEVCGDRITFYVQLDDAIITNISFRSFGCAVAVAAASMLTEAVKGKELSEAKAAAEKALEIVRSGTTKDKSHCSSMVEQVWKKTVERIAEHRTD